MGLAYHEVTSSLLHLPVGQLSVVLNPNVHPSIIRLDVLLQLPVDSSNLLLMRPLLLHPLLLELLVGHQQAEQLV